MASAEIEKAKIRIRKYLEIKPERGASEAECLMAARKIGELMDFFGLSMSDVEVREQPCKLITIDTGSKNMGPVFKTIVAIAKFCDCRCWYNQKQQKTAKYNFFGLEQDVAFAEYLFHTINNAMEFEINQFKNTDSYINSNVRRSASTSFGYGMAHRISQRLYQLKAERDAAMNAQRVSNTGTSLVVLKDQLVEREYNLFGMKLTYSTKTVRINNGSAYHDGVKAGNKVNLSRPIGSRNVGGYLS